ncbi:MAG TPA: hypothetical protein PLB12_05885 [Candidatus Goldiibacteriota bacterium]|nr:hypothetical protein [Candidatus Goldiibacteriota bacterium]HRQ43866.1 hypothetical protein [Candidatus Goldiibacteriota bacterium]
MGKFIHLIILVLILPVISAADTIKQNTDSDFYGGSLNAVSVVNTGADASLSLQSGQYALPGNGFVINGSNEYYLNTFDNRTAMAFSVPEYMTVTGAVILGYWMGTQSSYKCGITADSYGGTSPVFSQWLAPGNYNEIHNTLSSGSAYYTRVTFTSDAFLNASTPYHIYVEGVSGQDGSNYLRTRATTPNNLFYATSEDADPYQMVLNTVDSGSIWAANTDSQPVFVLEYLDPAGLYLDFSGRPVSYIGNPYNLHKDNSVYGTNLTGQVFDIKTDTVISKVRVYAKYTGASAPAAHLYIIIQDITDPLNEIMLVDNEVFILKAEILNVFSWISHTLINPLSLQAGHKYRISFSSSGSDSSSYYVLKGNEIFQNPSQDTVFSENALASSSFGGRDSYLVYTTGGLWMDYNRTKDLMIYMADSFSTLYAASGEYLSPPFDTKSSSTFTKISWMPLTQPALAGNDSIRFQIAANNDNQTWNFMGPDGTAGTWFTDAAGTALPGEFGNKRYIRYKIVFNTEDVTVSPAVDKVEIEYNARPGSTNDISLTNYPNPFRPGTEKTGIRYTLYEDTKVTITIMTPFSEIVKKYSFEPGQEGGKGVTDGYENKVEWDGKNNEGLTVESGIYICVVNIKEGDKVFKRKIAVLR